MRIVAALAFVGLSLGATTVVVWSVLADAPWEDARQTVVADEPSLSGVDAINLALTQISELGRFPGDTKLVRCVSADYRSGNHLWIVKCEFRKYTADSSPRATLTYSLDDRTGQLVNGP